MRRGRQRLGIVELLPFALAPMIWPVSALGQALPDTLDAYVVFALSRIDVSSSIAFDAGSIGVNAASGSLQGNGAIDLDPETGVIAAATTNLDPNRPSTCAAVFANNEGTGCGETPRLPFAPPLVQDVRAACGFPSQFPQCGQNSITVTGDTELGPETYGDVTVSGGTLRLSAGCTSSATSPSTRAARSWWPARRRSWRWVGST